MEAADFDCFYENTSTTESLTSFAIGKISLQQLISECWPDNCKQACKKIARFGVKKARDMIRKDLVRMGVGHFDKCPYCGRKYQ